ncbi:MAG TPA: hypothetical protein VK791_07650 [bacterium]|jgi:hypothetical protein|nr:hypothetical protein [bacterium]
MKWTYKLSLSFDEIIKKISAQDNSVEFTKRDKNKFWIKKRTMGRDGLCATMSGEVFENKEDYIIEWERYPKYSWLVLFLVILFIAVLSSVQLRDWFSVLFWTVFLIWDFWKIKNFKRDTDFLNNYLKLALQIEEKDSLSN